MKNKFEIEIKSLLGSREKADKLVANLMKKHPQTKLIGSGRQLNHYFNLPADISKLRKNLEKIVPARERASLDLLEQGSKLSVRTREANGKVVFVIKASVGDDTSSNGVKRREFECAVDRSLAELDKILLDSGCTYQAKWSRERQEYESGDMHVCIDKNAGYGYLAEFEKVVEDEAVLEQVRLDLLEVMRDLEAEELEQDRLERMFAHYNSHWEEYYGTDKTFLIE